MSAHSFGVCLYATSGDYFSTKWYSGAAEITFISVTL